MDRNFLELKHIKERFKTENIEDPALVKYQNMSYINFLNKKQRVQERILRGGNPDDDDENPSEDDSNNSDDSQEKEKTKNSA